MAGFHRPRIPFTEMIPAASLEEGAVGETTSRGREGTVLFGIFKQTAI